MKMEVLNLGVSTGSPERSFDIGYPAPTSPTRECEVGVWMLLELLAQECRRITANWDTAIRSTLRVAEVNNTLHHVHILPAQS
jgi:hypothetical protein